MLFNRDFSSPNYEKRQKEIQYVIFHYTELPFDRALEKLISPSSDFRVSAHFLVRKDGEVFQLVLEENVAWHAGVSYWRGEDKINHSSIGIEIDNLGREEFTEAQIDACLKLCTYLKAKYHINTNNFLGHSDIAPDRKIDPGFDFPWHLFAEKGFGAWSNQSAQVDNVVLYKFGDEGAHISELQSNLQQFGYKIAITQKFDLQTNYVVRAFRSRFGSKEIGLLGVDYYFSPGSKYDWLQKDQLILDSLIREIAK
jgi:N-acetylmuramoyl-L-alanine amidase